MKHTLKLVVAAMCISPTVNLSSTFKADAEEKIDLSSVQWNVALRRKPSGFIGESDCVGESASLQEVEDYTHKNGHAINRAFVDSHQGGTVRIRWKEKFATDIQDPGGYAGKGQCTGVRIAEDKILTAEHCLRRVRLNNPNLYPTPRRNGSALLPKSLVTLMEVEFGYQYDGKVLEETNDKALALREPITVTRLNILEPAGLGNATGEHPNDLDYAILQMGPADELPSIDDFPVAKVDLSQATLTNTTSLVLFQHPDGLPKKIATGPNSTANVTFSQNDQFADIRIAYSALVTLGGSSGSGIYGNHGAVIGVHTNGGCTSNGGFNRGISLHGITKSYPSGVKRNAFLNLFENRE